MLEMLMTQFAFFMTGYNPGTFMFSQVNVMMLLFKSHKNSLFFFSLRQTFLRCRNADCWSGRREREALCGAGRGWALLQPLTSLRFWLHPQPWQAPGAQVWGAALRGYGCPPFLLSLSGGLSSENWPNLFASAGFFAWVRAGKCLPVRPPPAAAVPQYISNVSQ